MKILLHLSNIKIISSPFICKGLIILFTFLNLEVFSQTYPPTCVVVEPYSNEYFKAGSNITIKVFSSDIGKTTNNGTISKVEFFSDGNKLGETTSGTNNYYTFVWNCVSAGTYRLTAKATNNGGVTFTSVGNIISVGNADVTENGISSGKGKYLANIIANSPNTQYNTYWNGVTAENSCKWGSVEGNRDNFNWGGADVTYNHAKDNNQIFRYHAAMWAAQYPSWLPSLSTADARAELVEYMEAIAARYPLIDQIDVLNEQLGNHQADNQIFRDLLSGIQNCPQDNFSWQIWLFEEARRIFPNTKLVLNDYGLENDQNAIRMQLDLIKVLRDRGLIDGFGSQAHCFNIDGLSANALQSSLDLMATGGVPIYITELDLNGGNESDNNESQQLSSYQTHFPVYWEHPAVAGITLWGYVTGATWIGGTGLMNSSGTEKSALTWMKNYVTGQPEVGYPIAQVPQGNCCSTTAPTVPTSSVYYAVGENASQLTATGTSLKWYDSSNNLLSTAPTPSTNNVGTTTYYVTETAECESQKTSITIFVYQPQIPYGGIPANIPGKIEFENFDEGGQDSAYYDTDAGTQVDPAPDFRTNEDVDIEVCTDDGGGYNIGFAMAGEWLEYTVDVQTAGTYNITFRAASDGDNKTVSLDSDGTMIAENVVIPNTGGWQIWTDVTVENVELEPGEQVLRLTIGDNDYVNLNYVTFTPVSVGPTISISSPVNNSEFNTSQTITISATASSESNTITSVAFYAGTELLFTDNTTPYSYDWSGMSEGAYEITAIATDTENLSGTDIISISITPGPIILHLKAGWNLIGFPYTESEAVETALSAIWNQVEVIKDFNGFYDKSLNPALNSLTTMEWGKGYFIKVNESCDLPWDVK
jgi:GH35 family endo-1,4-beta-xylanase